MNTVLKLIAITSSIIPQILIILYLVKHSITLTELITGLITSLITLYFDGIALRNTHSNTSSGNSTFFCKVACSFTTGILPLSFFLYGIEETFLLNTAIVLWLLGVIFLWFGLDKFLIRIRN